MYKYIHTYKLTHIYIHISISLYIENHEFPPIPQIPFQHHRAHSCFLPFCFHSLISNIKNCVYHYLTNVPICSRYSVDAPLSSSSSGVGLQQFLPGCGCSPCMKILLILFGLQLTLPGLHWCFLPVVTPSSSSEAPYTASSIPSLPCLTREHLLYFAPLMAFRLNCLRRGREWTLSIF